VELYLHSPNTPSWCGAQLKHRDNFTFYFWWVGLGNGFEVQFINAYKRENCSNFLTCATFLSHSLWISLYLKLYLCLFLWAVCCSKTLSHNHL
jgi:hypothetical protein